MILCNIKCLTPRFILALGYVLLVSIPLQLVVIHESIAAPAGMGGGMGSVCPPACPPNPANCDANLVITPTQSLQFGTMAAPVAGTVTVDTLGIRTSTGGVVLITGGAVTPASFSMSTTPYNCSGRSLVIVTVASPATLNGPGAPMSVDSFVTTPVAGDAFDPLTPLTVGGTLHVGTLQTPGTYTGMINVTITFQ